MAELEDLKQRLRDFATAGIGNSFTPEEPGHGAVAGPPRWSAFPVADGRGQPGVDAGKRGSSPGTGRRLLYLVMLADRLDVDLGEAARRKVALNEQRFRQQRARRSGFSRDPVHHETPARHPKAATRCPDRGNKKRQHRPPKARQGPEHPVMLQKHAGICCATDPYWRGISPQPRKTPPEQVDRPEARTQGEHFLVSALVRDEQEIVVAA